MKKVCWLIGLGTIAMLLWVAAGAAQDRNLIYSIRSQTRMTLAGAATELKKNRIILVGEQHTTALHHTMQLAVIRSLHEAGARVAIGMEMFRSDAHQELARWTSGRMSENRFIRIYYDNWNYDWSLYAPILQSARDQRLPVIGLNLSREITSQVARNGFKSLTEAQRGKLDEVSCRVDQTYMAFIKRAYGAHAHGNLDFTHFCEAQLVWDNIMAINALDYLKPRPDTVMVIIAGNGHAWKGGIPAQIRKRGDLPHTVILPEIEGVIEPGMIDTEDADYIFLNR